MDVAQNGTYSSLLEAGQSRSEGVSWIGEIVDSDRNGEDDGLQACVI